MYSYIKPTRFKINLGQEVDIILRHLWELFLPSCDFEFCRQVKIVERLGLIDASDDKKRLQVAA